MDASSVTTWIKHTAEGDSVAAQRLWERYLDRLIGLSADRLRNSPKRLADEEDLALAVFEEFLRKARQAIYPRLESRDDFWQIIIQLMERRAIDQLRRAKTYERHVSGESALGLNDSSTEGGLRAADRAKSMDVTPDDAVAFAEEFALLLSRLKTDEQRTIVKCRLTGMVDDEIAQQLHCSLRTVERRLQQIRNAWSVLMPPDEPGSV